jgi:hypothetical protein
MVAVFAHYVHTVMTALRDTRPRFIFPDGVEMALDSRCGILATTMPTSSQHLSVDHVPNIKALFRSIRFAPDGCFELFCFYVHTIRDL